MKESEPMTNWDACTAVEHHPRKISGALAFLRARVPVYALFENLECGATVKDFLEWYPEVKEWQVADVLNHEAESLKTTVEFVKILFDHGTPSPLRLHLAEHSVGSPRRGAGNCFRTGSQFARLKKKAMKLS